MKSIAAGDRNIKLLNNYDFKDNISEIYNSYELTRRTLVKSDIYAEIYIEQEKTKVLYQEKLNEKLEKEVNQDGLTGLYNRRYFDMIFPKELSRARRDKLAFTFVMMDIDHFKQYNDTYGHSEGDTVLKSIAKYLNDKLSRAGDFCFRLGGEEFGFFFTGNTLDEVTDYVKVICRGIEQLHIEHSKNSASAYVTASFGLIHFTSTSVILDADSIYIAADKALYKAKEDGRNRVVADDMKESDND
jgi:diguanylate cyclase (GGDEF)-like protein